MSEELIIGQDDPQTNQISIQTACDQFIQIIKSSRSENTALTYAKGLRVFCLTLKKARINIDQTPANQISVEMLVKYLDNLKTFSPATEQLYITTVVRFLHYLVAEGLININLIRVKQIVRIRSRRPGIRLPQFPREDIERVINYFLPPKAPLPDEKEWLRYLRDRAFLITLADTGLRVHEACNLRRGDIDWNEGHALIIGKGNKQAIVRFSIRSMAIVKEYLKERAKLDGISGRPLASLPLFARHDKGAGQKIKSITPTSGRNIVAERVAEVLGKDSLGQITPHSFRHYFVTTVLRSSNNLKLAQELARHSNISITQRYAHLSDDELDKGYFDIFNE